MASRANNLQNGVDDGGHPPSEPSRRRRGKQTDSLCAESVMGCLGATTFDVFM